MSVSAINAPGTFQVNSQNVHGRDGQATYLRRDPKTKKLLGFQWKPGDGWLLLLPKPPGSTKGFSLTYGGSPSTVFKQPFQHPTLGTIPAWDAKVHPMVGVGGKPFNLSSEYGGLYALERQDKHGVYVVAEAAAKWAAYSTLYLGDLAAAHFIGVSFDNLWLGLAATNPSWTRKGIGKVDPVTGKVTRWDLPDFARHYDNGLALALQRVREYLPGMWVGGNGPALRGETFAGDDPQAWLKCANVAYFENFQRRYDKGRSGELIGRADEWLSFPDPYGMPRVAAVIHGIGTVAKGTKAPKTPTSPAALQQMRWGLSAAVIAGCYYGARAQYAAGQGAANDSDFYFDEYGTGALGRGWLGTPTGPATLIAPLVWRREFQHGTVVHNASKVAVTVDLGGDYRRIRGAQNPKLNDGSLVRKVAVPALDGAFLAR